MEDCPMPKKRGRPPQLTDTEVALAMELRTEGVSWKIIAYSLGTRADTLMKRVKKAQANGMQKVLKRGHPVTILTDPQSLRTP
jgi:hypothetical protein